MFVSWDIWGEHSNLTEIMLLLAVITTSSADHTAFRIDFSRCSARSFTYMRRHTFSLPYLNTAPEEARLDIDRVWVSMQWSSNLFELFRLIPNRHESSWLPYNRAFVEIKFWSKAFRHDAFRSFVRGAGADAGLPNWGNVSVYSSFVLRVSRLRAVYQPRLLTSFAFCSVAAPKTFRCWAAVETKLHLTSSCSQLTHFFFT